MILKFIKLAQWIGTDPGKEVTDHGEHCAWGMAGRLWGVPRVAERPAMAAHGRSRFSRVLDLAIVTGAGPGLDPRRGRSGQHPRADPDARRLDQRFFAAPLQSDRGA